MEKTEPAQEVCQSRCHKGLGIRHLQAVYSFFGLVVAYILRLNLSMAVVGMTSSEKYNVDLTPETKAMVLSSMFWGYGLLQVVSGAYGRRGCALKLFAFGNFSAGILSLMIPFAAMEFGYIGICLIRFLVGLTQGNVYPNLNNFMAKWTIPQEKDPVMSIVQGGSMFGSLISMIISGYLGYHYDWPSIFYVSGMIGVAWGIIHVVVGSESPETCKIISKNELEYIRQNRKGTQTEEKGTSGVPWKEMLTSGPVISLVITNWCSSWASWTSITLSPTYISGVLGFNMADNGLVSALPYLFACISSIVFTIIAGFLVNKANLPISFLRPFWNSIAMYGNCATLIVLAFAPVTKELAVSLLTISMSVCVATNLGFNTNVLDLSPNYAGIIFSISNTTGNIAAIIGPLLSTYIIKDNSDIYQWRLVFTISAMISFIGNTVFIFWSSTKTQPWNEGKATTEKV